MQTYGSYPQLIIDLKALSHNAEYVKEKCEGAGIDVAGVLKGTGGAVPCADVFEKAGFNQLASSRIEQLARMKKSGIKAPLMMIRIPMLSEVREIVKWCDISLNSELKVLRSLNEEALRQNKRHGVILMVDVGDLREGFIDTDDLVDTACKVENEMPGLELLGTGTDVGCYGSILPSAGSLQKLVDMTEAIEEAIGRKVKYISGGATSSLMRIFDGDMPERINHLRIGEGILMARDLEVFYGYDMSEMRQDAYTLKAEIVELKKKPSLPIGESGVAAFGRHQVYEDRGVRLRAIAAVGKVDYGSHEDIFPKEEGIEIMGSSSDHLILDVENYPKPLSPGDIVEFSIDYASMVYLTASDNVKISYRN
jgi:predicted amino acid racemase